MGRAVFRHGWTSLHGRAAWRPKREGPRRCRPRASLFSYRGVCFTDRQCPGRASQLVPADPGARARCAAIVSPTSANVARAPTAAGYDALPKPAPARVRGYGPCRAMSDRCRGRRSGPAGRRADAASASSGQARVERLERAAHSRARRGDGRIPCRNRRNWRRSRRRPAAMSHRLELMVEQRHVAGRLDLVRDAVAWEKMSPILPMAWTCLPASVARSSSVGSGGGMAKSRRLPVRLKSVPGLADEGPGDDPADHHRRRSA